MILCCLLTKMSYVYYMFCSFSENLLDDFLLTYPVFMSTSDLCQALLGQYPSHHMHTCSHMLRC